MSALWEAQIAFAVAEFAADIGDDDPEASEAFDEALADLCASPPERGPKTLPAGCASSCASASPIVAARASAQRSARL